MKIISGPPMKSADCKGITLVELMVTLSILAVLVTLAVPSFNTLAVNNRVVSVTNELVASLNLAKSEAIKRGTLVSMCKTADPTAASPACSTSAQWENGWLIFVDGGTSGSVSVGDTILKVGQPSVSTATITVGSTNFVSYQSNGAITPVVTFQVCLQGVARNIAVNGMGRTSIAAGTC